ncbi:tetratricopeptide repeat protein [Sphingorhabdus sp.]|uniref:tetratricopeptide repeat protein n=1 Tax=Sphingorhabdus sp. TaxID=1902408 RepID=UPI0035936200
MGQIIQICKYSLGIAILAIPAVASGKTGDVADRYVSARIAEISEQNGFAVEGYLKLQTTIPQSDIIADRLFDSAIRAGDMPAAVRAARAQSLNKNGNAETALLLFADAWRLRKLQLAEIAADELASRGNLAFMSPVLKSWVRIKQDQPADFADVDPVKNGVLAYYSTDQRIYFDLATGQLDKAKAGLRAISATKGDFVRNVMISAAESMASEEADPAFAQALMRAAAGAGAAKAIVRTKMTADIGLAAFYSRIATALIEQNQPEEGLVLARIANWISPTRPDVQLAMAYALRANKLQSEALNVLESVPVASPYHPVALEKRIELLVEAKDAGQALIVAKQQVARDPTSVSNQLLEARVQEAVGNMAEVIAIYRAITEASDFGKLPPRQQASYRLLLASALERADDWVGAKAELETLLTLDPNNAQGLNLLGYSLLERNGDLAKALALVKRAYELSPDSSAIIDSLGWAYYLQGDTERALPLLEMAAKAAGSDVAINEHLGDIYWSAGRRREARYAWRVANLGSDGEAAERLSRKIDVGLIGRSP